MIDHRGTEFAEMHARAQRRDRAPDRHRGRVLLLTGSGSGALEAAVVNTFSPGDRVLASRSAPSATASPRSRRHSARRSSALAAKWGEAADPRRLAAHLAAASPYHAVLMTHNETSTGVANPLRALAAVVRAAPGDPLLLVDGISGLGAMQFEMDGWGIDLVVSASQKAWMGSPGIAIVALGDRALAGARNAPACRASTGTSPRHAELGGEGPDALDTGGQRPLRPPRRRAAPGRGGPRAHVGAPRAVPRQAAGRSRSPRLAAGRRARGSVPDGHRGLAARGSWSGGPSTPRCARGAS